MDEIIIARKKDTQATHIKQHQGYEYYKYELVPKRKDGQCKISLYEIPPGQAAYPYHYHTRKEEAFYILQGNGLLKTPNGEKAVTAR